LETTINDNPAGRFRNSNLAQAWLVLFLAMGFGAALAAMQVNLSGIIAANKLNETLQKIPELISDQTTSSDPKDIESKPGTVMVEKDGKSKTYAVYQATRKGQEAGWVIKTGGQGYADKIELLLGVDPGGEKITGLFVLEQKETPGLGNKITFADWRGQFIGKKTVEPLKVVKGKSDSDPDNTIDAITGATISSLAVTNIINQTVADVKGLLTSKNVKFIERQE
jgi:Na+-translocating ferredoxin:NAD+ oxidoreductase subunit G